MAAQTRPPDLWVVADDSSTDGTPELLRELAGEVPFMRVVRVPPGQHVYARDRLAAAAAPRTFNFGLRAADEAGFDFIGKIDGDVELPPAYLERLLEHFARDPRLGIAGGELVEQHAGRWRRIPIPSHHVPGAVKLYARECFEGIGGVHERLGWDTIDEMTARMQGYATRSYPDVVARHHRRTGGADGVLRGRARHGRCAWIAGYPFYFVLARALKLAGAQPIGLSGVAFVWGYTRAAATIPRVADRRLRRHVRRELRERILRRLSPQSRSAV